MADKKKAKDERKVVGEVKVIVASDEGNVVKRVDVHEDEDPAQVLAEEQAASGRNAPKSRKKIVEQDPKNPWVHHDRYEDR